MMLSPITVTLLGGPADLQRHIYDSGSGHYIHVAELPKPEYRYSAQPVPLNAHVVAKIHSYRIKQIGFDLYVGIHQDLDA